MEIGQTIGISLLGIIVSLAVLGIVWFGIVKFNEKPRNYSPGYSQNRKDRKSTRRTRRTAEA
jgi:hypothetical protein